MNMMKVYGKMLSEARPEKNWVYISRWKGNFTINTLPNQYVQLDFWVYILGVQFNFLIFLIYKVDKTFSWSITNDQGMIIYNYVGVWKILFNYQITQHSQLPYWILFKWNFWTPEKQLKKN